MEERLGDEYQRKRAAALAKRAKRKLFGDGEVVTDADVDAQMATAARLPQLDVSLGTFGKKKCKCLVYRKGGDCDCTLCMYVLANLRKFNVDIQRWHSRAGHGCSLACNDKASPFIRSLSDINCLLQHLLCERIEVPELTCARSTRPFKVFKRGCAMGTCCTANFGANNGTLSKRNCGWGANAPECSLLWNDEPHMWYRYEPTQVGTSKGTQEPILSEEFRPVFGARK